MRKSGSELPHSKMEEAGLKPGLYKEAESRNG
jgi:hypothetical protein